MIEAKWVIDAPCKCKGRSWQAVLWRGNYMLDMVQARWKWLLRVKMWARRER